MISNKKKMRMMGEIDSTGTPSAGLFAREYGSVYSFPVDREDETRRRRIIIDPQQQQSPSEFRNILNISTNEITLWIQGIILLSSLIFFLYIGFTGGITDGSDRFGSIANEFNGLGDESFDFTTIITPTIATDITDAILFENTKNVGIWL
jgi:hypothetical protein